MKYVSVDIETTGLNYKNDDIVEIAAIYDDTEALGGTAIKNLPRFHCYVQAERYSGHPAALAMHNLIFARIAAKTPGYQYLAPTFVSQGLGKFLREIVGATGAREFAAAGKNFAGFDAKFLGQLPGFGFQGGKLLFDDYMFHARTLDPAVLWTDWVSDRIPPSLEECMKRAGVGDWDARHSAIEDAEAVIFLIRESIRREKARGVSSQAALARSESTGA